MRIKYFIFTILSVFIIILISGCQAAPVELTQVPVQLAWKHQSQFAGLYAADQLGYYAEEGLAIKFVPGGSDVDKFANLRTGVAEFGQVSAAELITEHEKGLPFTVVASVNRVNPVVFISKTEFDIKKPQQFEGKTIRVTSDIEPILVAMLENVGIDKGNYTLVTTPSDVEMFSTGEIPIWGGFSSSFLINVLNAGNEVNIVYPDDYGVHFYSDVLVASDALIANDPDLVERFTRASLKGWTYAIEHPDEMAAFVQKYNPDADLAAEAEKMRATVPLVNTGEDHIGWMKPKIWEGMTTILYEQGMTKTLVEPTELYTFDFLNKIYK